MLVLASTSPYRRELLARLGRPFETISPQVDETPLADEMPQAMAARLAMAKAQEVVGQLQAAKHRAAAASPTLVLGSDQTATLDGRAVIGKPGTHARAFSQLRQASGQSMQFYTALAMIEAGTGKARQQVVATTVKFKTLTDTQIETYLRAETPYDCAGSAKSEGLGVSLLESVHSEDPTALIGLPLIAVCNMLAHFGQPVLPT